jgi:hypothetical protein
MEVHNHVLVGAKLTNACSRLVEMVMILDSAVVAMYSSMCSACLRSVYLAELRVLSCMYESL